MPKAYVVGYASRPKLEVGTVDVDFATCAEKAYCWGIKQEAQTACKELEQLVAIKIHLVNGRTHICKGFQVEEWKPGKFAVFCEIPFSIVVSGEPRI
jgi:hypothetical protein